MHHDHLILSEEHGEDDHLGKAVVLSQERFESLSVSIRNNAKVIKIVLQVVVLVEQSI